MTATEEGARPPNIYPMLADGGQWWGHADYLFGCSTDGHAGDQAAGHIGSVAAA